MNNGNPSVGERLKKRRKELGINLRDLALRTDLTASFLSQVERGVTNPSLNSLRRISEALNVQLLYFLAEDFSPKSPVVRAEARPALRLGNSEVSYELLTPGLTGKIEVIQGHLKPGTENIVRPLGVQTEELILVLSGCLLVGLEDQDYLLKPGDTIYFEGTSLHKLMCASTEDVTWVSVITPPVF
jgi:transcriptional regulator with XRE-family HTH domain